MTTPADFGDVGAPEFRERAHELVEWIARYLDAPERYPVLPPLVPGATLASIPDPASPTAVPRIQSDTAFLNGLMTRPNRLLERMWAPTAYVNGTIALVYAPYDFYIDGTFSHCGVDTFTLELAPQGWRVSHIAYTVQRTGCAPSPLGPPTDR